MTPRAPRPLAGFTFIEVLAILLVISFGLLGVVGLVLYGMNNAARSQGETTGMATAISVANDPAPLLGPETSSDWRFTPYNMDGNGRLSSTANGYINGYYVIRTEISDDADVAARDGAGRVQVRSARVEVDVYATIAGSVVASYTCRITRQRSGP